MLKSTVPFSAAIYGDLVVVSITMPTPAALERDVAAAAQAAHLELRPESVAFFARVGAFLDQRAASEAVYGELRVAESASADHLEGFGADGRPQPLQPARTLDALYAAAADALPAFSAALDDCVLGVTKATKLMQTHCKVAALKRRERVREKIANEYADEAEPCRHVKDVVRLPEFFFSSPERGLVARLSCVS